MDMPVLSDDFVTQTLSDEEQENAAENVVDEGQEPAVDLPEGFPEDQVRDGHRQTFSWEKSESTFNDSPK